MREVKCFRYKNAVDIFIGYKDGKVVATAGVAIAGNATEMAVFAINDLREGNWDRFVPIPEPSHPRVAALRKQLSRHGKLEVLADSEGYDDITDMLEANELDSVVPAICCNPASLDCTYSTGMEPDQDAGWCEECKAGTVVSCLVLAGVI